MAENTSLYVITAIDNGIYQSVQRTQPDIFNMPAWFHVDRKYLRNPRPDPLVIQRMDSYRNHGEICWICHTLHTILPIQPSPTNLIEYFSLPQPFVPEPPPSPSPSPLPGSLSLHSSDDPSFA